MTETREKTRPPATSGSSNAPALPAITPRTGDKTNWDAARNSETIKLAFEEATNLQTQYGEYAKSAETKIIAVFGVACALLSWSLKLTVGVVSVASVARSAPSIAWLVAIAMWVGAVVSCFVAYQPQSFQIGPDPTKLAGDEWLKLTPDLYRYVRLHYMGKTHDKNLKYLTYKGKWVTRAMVFTALEVIALGVVYLLA